jgi:hypothetical protein
MVLSPSAINSLFFAEVLRTTEEAKDKVKVFHNRPRWPKGFQVG